MLSWLARQSALDLTIRDWVITEFASALSVKVRMGGLGVGDRAKAASLFTRLQGVTIAVVPITRDHFLTAARFANQSDLELRAGDALHVAVAAGLGATLYTLDKRLAEAAIALGMNAEMV